MKRLVVCCDGTWNRPDQTKQGFAAPTNVAKIALALADEDDAGNPQVLHYEAGVGTRRGERLVGGVFGVGLSRNVQDCYRFVVDCYEPGDKLYFLGFSRGAYTARSTVGLVRNAGILRPEHRAPNQPGVRALSQSRQGQRAGRDRGRAVPALVLVLGDLRRLRWRLGHRRRARHPDRRFPSSMAEQAVDVSRHDAQPVRAQRLPRDRHRRATPTVQADPLGAERRCGESDARAGLVLRCSLRRRWRLP